MRSLTTTIRNGIGDRMTSLILRSLIPTSMDSLTRPLPTACM